MSAAVPFAVGMNGRGILLGFLVGLAVWAVVVLALIGVLR
jgi:hypothetical protein